MTANMVNCRNVNLFSNFTIVVFFKISQKQETALNPYHDTVENTYENRIKNKKKQLKNYAITQVTHIFFDNHDMTKYNIAHYFFTILITYE